MKDRDKSGSRARPRMVPTDEQELGALLRSYPRPLMRRALCICFQQWVLLRGSPLTSALIGSLAAPNIRASRFRPGARFDEQVRGVNIGDYPAVSNCKGYRSYGGVVDRSFKSDLRASDGSPASQIADPK